MVGCRERKKSLFEIALGEISIQDQVLYQVKFRLVLPTECENVLRCHPERSSDTNLLCVVDNWRSLIRFLFSLNSHTLYFIMIECLHRMLWDEREALSWVKLVICMFGYFLICLIQNVYEMCHFREATLLMGICKFDT